MTRPLTSSFLAVTVVLALASSSPAQNWDAVEIEVVPIADGIYVLVGSGGNIGLCVGEDGAFIIDDQFAPLTDKIKAAIATVTDAEVSWVVNTHWHGDHTGGNENFGAAGAMIVAHRNVRKRLNPDEFSDVLGNTQQADPNALPVVTFTDEVTFYWNGEKIRIEHVEHAHTDGDALIWFTDSNALHMGDNFFVNRYPFIDIDSGGNVNGMIAAADHVLAQIDTDTKIIPGHGAAVAGIPELQAMRDLLILARDRVRTMANDGMTLEEIIEARPMADYDDTHASSFVTPERFLTSIYRSLEPE